MIDISFKNKTGIKPEILSATIGSDSFFYGLFSKDLELLECKNYTISDFSDEEMIEKVKFDIYSIQNLKIHIASVAKPYLHSVEADSGKLMSYFPAFQNKSNNENKFTAQDVVVDYGITKNQAEFLKRVLNGNAKNFHISTVLSNYFYPYSKKQLVGFVDKDKIHFFNGKDSKFIYYNQFNCVHEHDYLYFTSLLFDQFGFDRDKDTLLLGGRVDSNSPIYSSLFGYIRNVEFFKSEKLVVSDLRFRRKQHYYLDLFATAICE